MNFIYRTENKNNSDAQQLHSERFSILNFSPNCPLCVFVSYNNIMFSVFFHLYVLCILCLLCIFYVHAFFDEKGLFGCVLLPPRILPIFYETSWIYFKQLIDPYFFHLKISILYSNKVLESIKIATFVRANSRTDRKRFSLLTAVL